MENNEELNIEKKSKKVELVYYRARFTQKAGAMLVDVFTAIVIGCLAFIATFYIVSSTSKYKEIDEAFDEAKLNSSLYVYRRDEDRIVDIVTYINSREDMASSEKENYMLDHIYTFFDSLPEHKEELIKEYNDFILDPSLVYNNEPYFIKDGESIIKNTNINIPISQYVDNVYKTYVDSIGLAEFIRLTPNVLDYQKYQSNMLFFVEAPVAITLGTVITFYIIPLIFFRGRKTLGRLAMRIGLVDSTYYNVGFWRFTARFAIFFFLEVILSIFTLCVPLIISLSMSAFSKERQNFHDYMLGIHEVDVYGTKVYTDKFDVVKGEKESGKGLDFRLK